MYFVTLTFDYRTNMIQKSAVLSSAFFSSSRYHAKLLALPTTNNPNPKLCRSPYWSY